MVVSYDGHFSDVVVIMSPKNGTKLTSQDFFPAPPPSRFLWLYYCFYLNILDPPDEPNTKTEYREYFYVF